MSLIIALVLANGVFLTFLHLAYFAVTRRRLKVALLVEHLATLARNGMPIHAGLRAVARDLGGYLGTRVQRVAKGLEEGKSLGEAFEAAPRCFPPALRNMLTLGERSGNLTGFLEELQRSYRRLADLPAQVTYLFLYPLLLSVGINGALAGFYSGIVPKFQTIFQQMELPSEPYEAWWPRLILANEIILVFCLATMAFMALGGTSAYYGVSVFRRLRSGVHRALLATPVLGGLIRDAALQQFALASALFLRSGAGLPEALRGAAEAERNDVLKDRFGRIARAVEEGSRFSSTLKEDGRIGEDFVWFVETGEAAGMLDEHLLLAATHYQTKFRIAARFAARAVVPTFVVLNGVVVFGTFALIFMPIQDILHMVVQKGR